MKVVIIGPFPPPMHGNSFANAILNKNLQRKLLINKIINTANDIFIDSKHGSRISLKKIVHSLKPYVNLLKIKSCDIVYITPGQSTLGVLKYSPFIFFSKILGKKVVCHLHGNQLGDNFKGANSVSKIIIKCTLEKCDIGIVLSESLKHNFSGIIGKDRIKVVYNFVPDELNRVQPNLNNNQVLKLLYLSNIITEKGIFELIEATHILKAKGIPFILNIAGGLDKGVETKFRKSIEHSSQIIFHGIVKGEDKINLFQSSNIFVLPTYYPLEGQPISILEAMASGNVILSTNQGGIPDIVFERNGFLIPPKSPEIIANTLVDLLNNQQKFREIRTYNYNSTSDKYSEERFTMDLIGIFEEIVD